jgi:hypothetical protein
VTAAADDRGYVLTALGRDAAARARCTCGHRLEMHDEGAARRFRARVPAPLRARIGAGRCCCSCAWSPSRDRSATTERQRHGAPPFRRRGPSLADGATRFGSYDPG